MMNVLQYIVSDNKLDKIVHRSANMVQSEHVFSKFATLRFVQLDTIRRESYEEGT